MKNSKQSGFAHVAVFAVIVVVAAVAGVGYFVFKSDNKSTSNGSVSTSSTTATTNNSESNDKAAVKKAAKDHFTLVYQKKTDEAYSSTCKGFRDITSEATFKSTLESGNLFSIDLSAIEYTSVEIRNSQAKISGPVGPLQPNSDLQVSLLKENGQWCVFGYEIV